MKVLGRGVLSKVVRERTGQLYSLARNDGAATKAAVMRFGERNDPDAVKVLREMMRLRVWL